jgi:hypothetical protein
MDAAGELNWVSGYERAFEVEINSERWKMEAYEIEQATARLRVSREEYEETEKRYGEEKGRLWALEDADYRSLKVVAGYELGELTGDEEADEPTHAWVLGFFEGAKQIWAKVEDKI